MKAVRKKFAGLVAALVCALVPVLSQASDIEDLRVAIAKGDASKVDQITGADRDLANTAYDKENAVRPLHHAAYNGNTNIVALLIKRGASLEARTSDGKTALMMATIEGHKGVVACLIDAGADVNAKTKTGMTAIVYAAHFRLKGTNPVFQEIENLLKQKGAVLTCPFSE
jgi:ankyrin repeat protein